MEMKRMFVQVVNLTEGKVFSLPTLYTDRVEACVCGQNYVRDRQTEDRFSLLFFRVMISYDGKIAEPFNIYDEEEGLHPICDYDEDDCDGECERCGLCCEDEDEEDTEESNYRELMEGILEVCEEYGVNLVIPRT